MLVHYPKGAEALRLVRRFGAPPHEIRRITMRHVRRGNPYHQAFKDCNKANAVIAAFQYAQLMAEEWEANRR